MRLKVKLTVLVLAALVLSSLSAPAMAQDEPMSVPLIFGTIDADVSFEIANTITPSGTTTMTGDNGKTFWYDVDDFAIDFEMLLDLINSSDSGEQAIAASAINSMNTVMQMGDMPEISDLIIIDGDLTGSQIFVKLLREVELATTSAYEFVPGIVTGEAISFALNTTTLGDFLPVDFPLEMTNVTIPANLPVAYTGVTMPHALDNLTFWAMMEPMENKEPGLMDQIFGPYFSPVLMDTTEGWAQNTEFYEDMFTHATDDINENDTIEYDVTYTPGTGLEIDVNFTHAGNEKDMGMEQRINVIWSDTNGGWVDYILLELTPEGEESPLVSAELSYSETTAAFPIGVQTGDTGSTGTGNVSLDLELTGDFADLIPADISIADIEDLFATISDVSIFSYEIGDFDGMYYGLDIFNVFNFSDVGGAQEDQGPPDNLVVNSWNGMIYMNETEFIDDYHFYYEECTMNVESNIGTINFPLNMSEIDNYWHDWSNWDTILGVFEQRYYDYNVSAEDYDTNKAVNLWNPATDDFDGLSLTLDLEGEESIDNETYRVVIVYESMDTSICEYDGHDFNIRLNVESGTGTAKLPKRAPKYGVDILAVFNHSDYNWDLPREEYESQAATNYWDPAGTFDGENLTISELTQADGLYDIVIIASHKPLDGHGIYISLFEAMNMNGGDENPNGAQDPSPEDSGPSPEEIMGYISAAGLFSPAVSPEWWYYEDMTNALNETLTDTSDKFNALYDFFWTTLTSDPTFPADRFVEEPTIFLDMSAGWDGAEVSREVMMSLFVDLAVEGSLLDPDWPFKSDTNITIDLAASVYEDWTATGIMESKGVDLSLSLEILNTEPPITTTTTTTTATTSETTTVVDFTPGFEIISFFALVLVAPVVVRKRRK